MIYINSLDFFARMKIHLLMQLLMLYSYQSSFINLFIVFYSHDRKIICENARNNAKQFDDETFIE